MLVVSDILLRDFTSAPPGLALFRFTGRLHRTRIINRTILAGKIGQFTLFAHPVGNQMNEPLALERSVYDRFSRALTAQRSAERLVVVQRIKIARSPRPFNEDLCRGDFSQRRYLIPDINLIPENLYCPGHLLIRFPIGEQSST
jgi:hypothetical protein